MLDDATSSHELLRIIQEAVNNAARHANATQIEIELEQEPGSVSVSVVDDGIGMPEQEGHSDGLGLCIMQHRASVIGAALEIAPASGGGTAIVCKLSIANSKRDT